MLNQLLTMIKCLSCEWNIAVLLTNQMQSDPGGGMTFVSGGYPPGMQLGAALSELMAPLPSAHFHLIYWPLPVTTADPKKPIGGHILAHQVHTRLMLRKGSGDQRFAKLICSARMPERDGSFRITEGGVADCD